MTHVKKAAGAELPVARESAVAEGFAHRVYVGDMQAVRRLGISPDELPFDTWVIMPKDRQGERPALESGVVDEQAWVYVNGILVGEHTIKSTGLDVGKLWDQPFTIEVKPEHLRHGAEDTLVVRVHNIAFAGGIHKPVVGHAFYAPQVGHAEPDCRERVEDGSFAEDRWVALGLVHAYRETGHEPAIVPARKLLNHTVKERRFFDPDGTFGPSTTKVQHFHSHTHVLLGYFPEKLGRDVFEDSEICEVADMIALGIKLSHGTAFSRTQTGRCG